MKCTIGYTSHVKSLKTNMHNDNKSTEQTKFSTLSFHFSHTWIKTKTYSARTTHVDRVHVSLYVFHLYMFPFFTSSNPILFAAGLNDFISLDENRHVSSIINGKMAAIKHLFHLFVI